MIAYFVIFILAATPFLEVVGIIPIGIAAGLPAWSVTIIAFSGNMLTIWLLIGLMDRFQKWFQRRREQKRQARAQRVWQKYGLAGLSLLSPILIGSHLGTFLAMSFGASKRQITLWMTASIIIWAVLAGVLSKYGFELWFEKTGSGGFLEKILTENSVREGE